MYNINNIVSLLNSGAKVTYKGGGMRLQKGKHCWME